MHAHDHSGGCQCGAIRFRITGRLGDASICHCRMCQKAFGGYYAALVAVGEARLRWTRGWLRHFQSSNLVRRGFCAQCGTPLTYEAPDGIAIAAGAFDDPSALPPRIQYGAEGKLPFVDTLSRLPAHRTEDDIPAAPWLARVIGWQHPDHDTACWRRPAKLPSQSNPGTMTGMSRQSHWVVGINPVAAAIAHDGGNVREVLLEAGAKNPRITRIEHDARRRGIELRRVSQQALDGVAGGLRHQGAAARYAAAPTWGEDALPGVLEAASGHALLLALDGVQDPHNLGACLRSAAAAGVDAVLIPKDKAVPVNATVRKVAAGAADSVPVIRVTNLARALSALRTRGVWVYGLAGDATTSVYELDLSGEVALVLGGEADGLRRLTRERCDRLAALPMPGAGRGSVESLNVSVAAGVALFEAVRQRLRR